MCVAIPARIEAIEPGPMPMATLQEGVTPPTCCLAYTPEARVGDYVLVQNGFAIQSMDPEEAANTLAVFQELGLTT